MLNPTSTTIAGSFTASNPAANEYLVVRSLAAQLNGSPVDGTNYAPGAALGDGIVVSTVAATDFNAIGLTPNTPYFFFVFALNNENCAGAPNYNSTNPLQLSVNTLPLADCINPPNPPTNLILNPGNTSVSGSFNAAANANRYLVVRSTNPVLNFTPTNGITYTAGQVFGNDIIVKYNNNTNFSAVGLVANTQYFFFVFSANGDCNGEPFYNATSLNAGTTTTENGQGIPPGYYQSADGLGCSELKTALFNIIKPLVDNPNPDYGGICNIYESTDYRKSDDGLRDIIWDMYSDNPGINNPDPYEFEYGVDVDGCGGSPDNPPLPGTDEGLMYNREHSFPRNWFGGAVEPMNSDIMHIFPTDKEVNAKRNNFPYGETNMPSWTSLNGSKLGNSTFPGYGGIVFEPINEYKGDFARAQFYIGTCYEDRVIANNWSINGNANEVLLSIADEPDAIKRKLQVFDDWYVDLLYKWHLQDPVSAKEIDRNNAVYAIQANRNPFVDHPEYVDAMLGCTGVLPVTITNFTVAKNDKGSLLKWSATFETNFKKFEIEQSTNGVSFIKIGEVAGNNLLNYSFASSTLPKAPTVFYRLKMIDADAKFSYSKIVALQLNTNQYGVKVYPNPAAEKVTIQFEQGLSLASEMKIVDFTGRIVLQQKVNAGQQNINVAVNALPPGRYLIKIISGNEIITQSFTIIR
ncbi:MAG: endonuclease [Chitinophagaceae bacterium]|nr:endonuclease [Chitinophagaceae bacterium]